MKIIDDYHRKRSWCLALASVGHGCVELRCVDSNTEYPIAALLGFTGTGKVVLQEGVEEALTKTGYDPHEHGNSFDKNGCIYIVHPGDDKERPRFTTD